MPSPEHLYAFLVVQTIKPQLALLQYSRVFNITRVSVAVTLTMGWFWAESTRVPTARAPHPLPTSNATPPVSS